MHAQLLGDLGAALAVGRPHPPADISLDGLAVRTHWSVPSGPLVVEMVGMERHHLSWQRGTSALTASVQRRISLLHQAP